MNKALGWILVGVTVVLVVIAAAAGLVLLRGGDGPAHPSHLAGAPSKPDPGHGRTAVPVAEAVPGAPPSGEGAQVASEPVGQVPVPGAVQESPPGPSREGVAPGPVALTVWELLSAEAGYAGREVILTGRIVTLCIRGCRLSLDDGTGVMPVELVDDALNRTIPPHSTGRRIEVRGIFQLTPRPHVTVERPDGWRFP